MVAVEVPGAVRAVVRAYQRRAGWLEAADLQQQAALTMIEAARTWRPEGVPPDAVQTMTPLEAYQVAAVARNLKRYIAAQASPVHETHGQASGAQGCSLEALASAGEAPRAEFHIDLGKACAEVARILAGRSPAVRAVLLEERKPAEVAADLGVPVQAVYQAVNAATRALRASRKLARLAEAVLHD